MPERSLSNKHAKIPCGVMVCDGDKCHMVRNIPCEKLRDPSRKEPAGDMLSFPICPKSECAEPEKCAPEMSRCDGGDTGDDSLCAASGCPAPVSNLCSEPKCAPAGNDKCAKEPPKADAPRPPVCFPIYKIPNGPRPCDAKCPPKDGKGGTVCFPICKIPKCPPRAGAEGKRKSACPEPTCTRAEVCVPVSCAEPSRKPAPCVDKAEYATLILKDPPTKPCAAKPCAAKPSAAKPCAEKPSAAKPSAAKPCAAKPCAAKPGAAKPCAAKPCAAKPCAAKPGAAKPCAAKPCAAKPCAAKPCAEKPCAEKPCAEKPCPMKLGPPVKFPEKCSDKPMLVRCDKLPAAAPKCDAMSPNCDAMPPWEDDCTPSMDEAPGSSFDVVDYPQPSEICADSSVKSESVCGGGERGGGIELCMKVPGVYICTDEWCYPVPCVPACAVPNIGSKAPSGVLVSDGKACHLVQDIPCCEVGCASSASSDCCGGGGASGGSISPPIIEADCGGDVTEMVVPVEKGVAVKACVTPGSGESVCTSASSITVDSNCCPGPCMPGVFIVNRQRCYQVPCVPYCAVPNTCPKLPCGVFISDGEQCEMVPDIPVCDADCNRCPRTRVVCDADKCCLMPLSMGPDACCDNML